MVQQATTYGGGRRYDRPVTIKEREQQEGVSEVENTVMDIESIKKMESEKKRRVLVNLRKRYTPAELAKMWGVKPHNVYMLYTNNLTDEDKEKLKAVKKTSVVSTKKEEPAAEENEQPTNEPAPDPIPNATSKISVEYDEETMERAICQGKDSGKSLKQRIEDILVDVADDDSYHVKVEVIKK